MSTVKSWQYLYRQHLSFCMQKSIIWHCQQLSASFLTASINSIQDLWIPDREYKIFAYSPHRQILSVSFFKILKYNFTPVEARAISLNTSRTYRWGYTVTFQARSSWEIHDPTCLKPHNLSSTLDHPPSLSRPVAPTWRRRAWTTRKLVDSALLIPKFAESPS